MKLLSGLLILLSIGIICSCGNPKKLQYMQGPFDPSLYGKVNYQEPLIKTGDILGITVYSDNPAASAIYNQAAQAPATPGALANTSNNGYLVDNNGDILFHSLGKIHVKGLTRLQVADTVTRRLEEKLMNPYCQVRFNNFRITVIGEVKNPSVFSIPSEKISVLEVLGLAGDLTGSARRDSVMIIRESDSTRKFGWMDLRRTDIFASEYFYLQQNDVVVVHPSKRKSAADDQVTARNIGIAATIVSTIAIVLTVFK